MSVCSTKPDDVEYISAKFHFVDLAGSERAHRTGNEGERFKGVAIHRFNLLSKLVYLLCVRVRVYQYWSVGPW